MLAPVQELGADDAATLPNARAVAEVDRPSQLMCGLANQIHTLLRSKIGTPQSHGTNTAQAQSRESDRCQKDCRYPRSCTRFPRTCA
jgi:hypothetical protein